MKKNFSSNPGALFRAISLGALSLLCSCSLATQPELATAQAPPLNTYVLAAVKSMPAGRI